MLREIGIIDHNRRHLETGETHTYMMGDRIGQDEGVVNSNQEGDEGITI
jgi:hypothetical protein